MNNALERYVEELMKERNQSAWEKLSKDVGEVCRAEDQRVVILVEQATADDNPVGGYDYMQNADKIIDQVEHDIEIERAWDGFNRKLGDMLVNAAQEGKL